MSDFLRQTYLSSLTSPLTLGEGKGPQRVKSGKRGEEERGQGLVSPEQLGDSEEALAQTKEEEAAEGSWAMQSG